ncbi:MAG: S1 RNA-binding domain-containing protein [Negativicutes bacterium]|nr:S1 RNA-binding domain-containing protein [Negativicutes bacterium]
MEVMDIEAIDRQMEAPRRGEIRQATVISARRDSIIVDIGYKGEGIILPSELAWPIPDDCRELAKEGDCFPVMVIGDETGDGLIKLSKTRAEQAAAWERLAEAYDQQRPVTVKVTAKVKGGVTVAAYGIRGFIPNKQIDIRYVSDLDGLIGQELEAAIIEFDREQRKLVLSRRQILQQERERLEQAAFAALAAGQKVKGTVVRLADFGAFVDIGGVDGLVHLNDLSWQRVKNPSEVVEVGYTGEFMVIDVNPERKRIALSLKALQVDPWLDKVQTLGEQQVLTGKVVSLTKFGAFVNLLDGVDGLVPLKEVEEMKSRGNTVLEGEPLTVKVVSVDKKRKRIALSAIEAAEAEQRSEMSDYLVSDGGATTVTIGDKFSEVLSRVKVDG